MQIRIGNYAELLAKITALQARLSPENLTVAIRESRRNIAIAALDWISVYPPESAANQPKPYPGRWYQRGFGSKWALKGGGSNGRQTSEHLGDNWAVADQGAIGATITNTTSYAAVVQSAAKQPEYHRRHGWRTDRSLVEWLVSSGTALNLMRAAIAKVLGLGSRAA